MAEAWPERKPKGPSEAEAEYLGLRLESSFPPLDARLNDLPGTALDGCRRPSGQHRLGAPLTLDGLGGAVGTEHGPQVATVRVHLSATTARGSGAGNGA